MRVRIYIAGPMTGYENFNREAFHRAEDALKREGHTVLNPAVLPDGLTQPHYMDICMAMLRCVDAVYMLKGWQQSAGARAELALAEKLGHAVIFRRWAVNIDPAITIDMALNTGLALLGYFYIMFCSGRWLSLLFKNGINAVSRSNARRQWMHFSKPSGLTAWNQGIQLA